MVLPTPKSRFGTPNPIANNPTAAKTMPQISKKRVIGNLASLAIVVLRIRLVVLASTDHPSKRRNPRP
jgi:hypothetical protein